MLASFDEAEDAVQETFLRAWRSRETFDGRARPGLALPHRHERLPGHDPRAGTAGAGDALVRRGPLAARRTPTDCSTRSPPSDDEPDAVAVARETIELAFLAALQVLPPRQRAALLARDVLGCPAAETAALLETQRRGGQQRAAAGAGDDAASTCRRTAATGARTSRAAAERDLLDEFIDAHERCDAEAAMAVAAEDIRITMPPTPDVLRRARRDRAAAGAGVRPGPRRRLAAAADHGRTACPRPRSYLRRPGDTEFRAFKFDVLRVEGGRSPRSPRSVRSCSTAFGLPLVLPEST